MQQVLDFHYRMKVSYPSTYDDICDALARDIHMPLYQSYHKKETTDRQTTSPKSDQRVSKGGIFLSSQLCLHCYYRFTGVP